MFEGKFPNPESTMQQIANMHIEYSSMLTTPTSRNNLQQEQHIVGKYWRPLLEGIVKVNLDASFLKTKGVGCSGIVVRNHKGEVLSWLTRKFHTSNSLTAEAIALRDAMNLAYNLDVGRAVFECDNLELVKNCRGKTFSGEIQHLVQDIQEFKNRFSFFLGLPGSQGVVMRQLAYHLLTICT